MLSYNVRQSNIERRKPMGKVLGLNPIKGTSKKTGKPFDAVMVSYADSFSPTDDGAVGQQAVEMFVDRMLFDKAAKGRALNDLVGRECKVVYGRTGFISDFQLA
jgi:hypothetical protein